MRIGVRWAVVAILALASATCGGAVSPQYEYEEEMYLSLDGSATMWVHSSILALNALRGTAFDERPNARVDPNAVRAYFNSSAARVLRVTSSRRKNRRFVHVRLEIDDVRQLSAAPPFAWSSYELKRSGEFVAYKQAVGPPSHGAHASADVTKGADESVVAFRIHAPSQVVDHNAGAGNHRRGNILVWEQSLSDRLNGVPLAIEALLEPRSILSRTLFLFGATIAVVALMFAIIIWRVVRKGSRMAQRPS